MTCSPRHDIRIIDPDGEAQPFVCDWKKGGSGLQIEKGTDLSGTRLATKGEYGVKDANDYMRIIQTDWVLGAGQETYDLEDDSESAFSSSRFIDVSNKGEFRLAPRVVNNGDTTALPCIINHSEVLWGGFTDVATATNRIKYSYDGYTWTAITGTGPTASPTCFASDGTRIWCVTTGELVYQVTGTGVTVFADASNADMTHIAEAAGTLYTTKKSVGWYYSQLGYWDSNATAASSVWHALSPVGGSIDAPGDTVGLERIGTHVYWTVGTGSAFKVFKAQFVDGTNDVFEAVTSLPTGFVAAATTSYLNTLYVGGYFYNESGLTTGAIYMIENDTPALLHEFPHNGTTNTGISSMSCYGHHLYFTSDRHVYRWDIRNGGYSHYSGPLNSTPTIAYESIAWDGTWTCNVLPGAGAEPDATVTSSGTTSAASDGTYLNITFSTSNAWRKYLATEAVSSINDTTGTTLEVDLPANFAGIGGSRVDVGIDGSAHKAHLQILQTLSTRGGPAPYIVCSLYSGSTLLSQSVCSTAAHTFRLTLKNGRADVYIDNNHCMSNSTPTANTTEAVWLRGYGSFSVSIGEMRWTDAGAYDPAVSLSTAVSGVAIATFRDRVSAACSGVGVTTVYPAGDEIKSTAVGETPPYIRASRSSGNMPTVEKYFHGISVTTANIVPSGNTITVSGSIDGVEFLQEADDDESTDTSLFFPLSRSGRNIQYQINLNSDSTTNESPVITEVAVLCRPTPKTTHMHSYFLRVWDTAEDNLGGLAYKNAGHACDFLENTVHKTVTVERADGADYTGYIESLEFIEAPPSKQSSHRQGIYQVNVRRLA